MRGQLLIEGVEKRFGNHVALRQVDLAVEIGDLVCLLGPSGCGKTTLLRIIAGFERPTRGRVWLDGRDITELPPQQRGLGMVFQSLALFPHMTVAQNIGYGLRRRAGTAAAKQAKVEDLLTLIRLPGMGERPVTALSGGQRQRVAIARALAVEPRLFLLDEPFSALDAQLRDQMQIEVRQLQQQLGITTLFVTHDQEEAMRLGDQIAVFKDGDMQQLGSPTDVYRNPANAFVATFLGAANVTFGTAIDNETVEVLGVRIPLRTGLPAGTPVEIAIRAESLTPESGGESRQHCISGRVQMIRDIGSAREIVVEVAPGMPLRCRTTGSVGVNVRHGEPVLLSIDPHGVAALRPRAPTAQDEVAA